jgi:hypothetical protein
VDRQIDAGFDDLVAALVEECAQPLAPGLDRSNQDDWTVSLDRVPRAFERL